MIGFDFGLIGLKQLKEGVGEGGVCGPKPSAFLVECENVIGDFLTFLPTTVTDHHKWATTLGIKPEIRS